MLSWYSTCIYILEGIFIYMFLIKENAEAMLYATNVCAILGLFCGIPLFCIKSILQTVIMTEMQRYKKDLYRWTDYMQTYCGNAFIVLLLIISTKYICNIDKTINITQWIHCGWILFLLILGYALFKTVDEIRMNEHKHNPRKDKPGITNFWRESQ